MPVNLNELAKELTLEETADKELSIAKIKKIIKLIAKRCAQNPKVIEALIRIGSK